MGCFAALRLCVHFVFLIVIVLNGPLCRPPGAGGVSVCAHFYICIHPEYSGLRCATSAITLNLTPRPLLAGEGAYFSFLSLLVLIISINNLQSACILIFTLSYFHIFTFAFIIG